MWNNLTDKVLYRVLSYLAVRFVRFQYAIDGDTVQCEEIFAEWIKEGSK